MIIPEDLKQAVARLSRSNDFRTVTEFLELQYQDAAHACITMDSPECRGVAQFLGEFLTTCELVSRPASQTQGLRRRAIEARSPHKCRPERTDLTGANTRGEEG